MSFLLVFLSSSWIIYVMLINLSFFQKEFFHLKCHDRLLPLLMVLSSYSPSVSPIPYQHFLCHSFPGRSKLERSVDKWMAAGFLLDEINGRLDLLQIWLQIRNVLDLSVLLVPPSSTTACTVQDQEN